MLYMQGCGRSLLASEPSPLPSAPNSGLFVYNITDGAQLRQKLAEGVDLPGEPAGSGQRLRSAGFVRLPLHQM